MKTKLSKRVIACLLVTVMLIGVFMAIPASGEWVAPDDWVEMPDPDNATWDRLWSWDRGGTGMPDPNDPNEGLPFSWGTHEWLPEGGYAADFITTVLNYDKTTKATSVKAGDVVWVKVDVANVNMDIFTDGFTDAEYLLSFDDRLAFPFMLPGDIGWNGVNNGIYLGEFEDADYETISWFQLAFKKNVNKRMNWDDSSKYIYRYSTEQYEKDGLGIKISLACEDVDNNIKDGDVSWWFPIQISEDAADGETVTFTIPYPTETAFVSGYPDDKSYDPVQLLRGSAISVVVDNYADVAANLAAGAAYAFVASGSDLSAKTEGFATDLLRPLTPNANYDTVAGDAIGALDFRAPADVNSVTLTFNTNENSAVPTAVKVFGVKADGSKVELGTVNTGVAVNEGVENTTFDWNRYPFENFTNWTDEKYKTVNAANAYTFTVSGFEVDAYTGIYFEATATEGKSVSLGEIEVAGEFAKYAINVENGFITSVDGSDLGADLTSGEYASGTVLEITANVPADFDFIGWTIDENGDGAIADSSANTTTFVVGAADTTVTANLEATKYALTVQNGTGSGDYAKGTVVDITALAEIADQSGRPNVFSHWEVVSGDATITNTNASETTVVTNGVATIIAVYKLASYNLTVVYGSGDGLYEYDATTTIVADERDEKVFSHWEIISGTAFIADENSAETTVRVLGEATIEAIYTDKVYSFDVVNGTATPDDGEFKKGTELTITADAPADGKFFAGWEITSGSATITDASSATTTVITSNVATVITAIYKDKYTVVVNGGTGDGQYAPATEVTITADSAVAGDTFYKWIVDSGSVSFADGYDEYDAVAKIIVNADVEVTSKYLPLYADAPANLANGSTVSVLTGSTMTFDAEADKAIFAQLTDNKYPLLEQSNWPLIYSANGTVKLMFALDKVYEINKVVVDAGFIANNNFSYLPDGITVYGSNTTDGSNAVELVSASELCTDINTKWTNLEADTDITGNSYLYTLEVPESKVDNYQYVIIEFDCSWTLLDQKNSHLRLGEVEIYGDPAKYMVETVDATIEGYESSTKFETGTVLTIVPNPDTVEKAFDMWTYCGSGTLDAANNTWTVGTGDATITANYVDINKPAPDNIAPNASLSINDGTVSGGDSAYINDQIYAITEGAKWTAIDSGANGATLVFALGDYFDLESVAVEYKQIAGKAFPPIEATIYGTNSVLDGSVTQIGTIKFLTDSKTVVDFDVPCNLTSVANRISADVTGSYKYVIIEFSYLTTDFPVYIGEIEIYGVASASKITVENGTATPVEPDGGYDVGETVTITANEIADKIFTGWTVVSGDAVIADPTAATTTVTVGFENSVIKANYDDILYDVDVVKGTIDADDVQADGYVVGTVIGITADTIQDKVFVEWKIVSGNGTFADQNSATTTFTTGSGDTVIEAVYADALYKVTVQSGTVQNGNDNGYTVGTVVTIIADAPAAGKEFAGWEIVSGTAVIADPTAATTTVTVGSGDVVVKATYKDIPYSVTVDNGAIVGVVKEEYFYGDVVSIVANAPEAHKEFAGWTIVSGEGAVIADSTSATTTVTVGTSDVVVRAEYVDVLYKVNISGGYVDEDDYSEDGYVIGSVLDISANIPEIGTEFVGWEVVEGDAVIADPTAIDTTVTVGAEDSKIAAVFAKIPYTLTIMNGTVEEGAKEEYFYGDEVTIVADDIEGKEFIGWTIVSGEGATIKDATSDTTTIKFGADDIVVEAKYKDVVDTPPTGDNGFVWYLILALIALCGFAALAYNKKRCK